MSEVSKPHSRPDDIVFIKREMPKWGTPELRNAVERLIEQLEAAESILRLADSPVVHAEMWAQGVHARARVYWRGSNPAKERDDG